jgi:hypothetical protein
MAVLKPTIERRNNFMGVPVKRVSWSSILSGVVVSMAAFVTLSMLGIAVGLLGSEASFQLGTTAGLFWAGIGALSLFAGGWTAGRLCGLQRRFEGAIHGIITWAVASVVLVIFAGSSALAPHGIADSPPESTFRGPPEAALQQRWETVPTGENRAVKKRMEVEHLSNEIARHARALLDRSDLSEEEKVVVYERVAPRIAPLVDSILRPDYENERTMLISALVNSTGLHLQAVTSEVDRWVAIASMKAEERRMSKGKGHRGKGYKGYKGKGPQVDGMGPRRDRARLHQPWPTFSVDARALAGWNFLLIALGAVTAILGGMLGSGAMTRRGPAPTMESQAPSAPTKNPIPGEE